ncbi:DUF924 domain-containing protein [Thiomicrorhabdus sp. ZW0627]|uniref:DUF924 family protein n=1 Tax=Thiomicrorhabdus sp. ZW0627 TaxID=3039774 RepID=UPI002436A107|nr:DUF924 domain-containing protein [Thiomicrorhabdus sp. ZW0627]MDG6772857.1 DUF924 domain-containing protein [Thiomicrorhabdus sp. ZW0627]
MPGEIIDFWYTLPMTKHWFRSTPEIDEQIRSRYESLWEKAADGGLDEWKQTAEGCLALCIVLDQFPLNMFRGEAKGFASEDKAVEVSRHAVSNGLDLELPVDRRAFLYMPLMHSENLRDQDESVRLFEASGLESNLRFARHHRELIRRFGRFPHRNVILERENTTDEKEYLSSPEAFTG